MILDEGESYDDLKTRIEILEEDKRIFMTEGDRLRIENIRLRKIVNDKQRDTTSCTWTSVDDGMMGFHDYEWHTSCGRIYSCNHTLKETYCPNCGKVIT